MNLGGNLNNKIKVGLLMFLSGIILVLCLYFSFYQSNPQKYVELISFPLLTGISFAGLNFL